MRWPAATDGLAQQFSTLDAPKTLSVARGAWGESGRAATPEMLATLASRGMGALSDAEGCWHRTGGDARRPVATGDARFYRQNAPVTTGSA